MDINKRIKFEPEPICNTILDLLYIDIQKEIQCDLLLFNDIAMINGKALIRRNEEYIKIECDIDDCIFKKELPSNVINISDVPNYYECNLTNLPKENMKKYLGKVEIVFLKVSLMSDIQIDMNFNATIFKGNVLPLYDYKSKKVMNVISCEYK